MSTRLVVADDHPITRTGTIAILQHDDSLDVVGEAEDGPQTLAMCQALRPDLLLLDLRLPRMSGIAVARALGAMAQPPRVLMLSAYSDAASVRAALDAGAAGYVLKSAAGADLLAAIQRVLRGEQVLLGVSGSAGSSRAPVSPQELTILGLVAKGLTSKEIAQRIGNTANPLSTRTVETYLGRVYEKLGARNRAEAVTRAQHEGLLPLEKLDEQ